MRILEIASYVLIPLAWGLATEAVFHRIRSLRKLEPQKKELNE